MKTRYFLLLTAIALVGIGATYTITQLTENATPGAGTIIEIYDPTATPKSGKITLDSNGFRNAAGLAIGTDVQPYDVDLSSLSAGKTGIVLGYGNGLFYDAVTPIAAGVLICPDGINTYEFTTDLNLNTLNVTNGITAASMELTGDLGADSLYLSGLVPGFVYLDANTNLVNVDATAEASFDLLAVNDGSALTSTGATNGNQLITLSQLEAAVQGNVVSYFNTAAAADGFTLTGTVKSTNWNSYGVIPALSTNAAVTAADGDYIAAFITTNTYSRLAFGLAVVELYAFENDAGSGAIKAEVYIINSETMAEEYEFEPSPAYQTVFAGATPTKLTFSIPVTDYTSTTNFYIAVKVKVQESGVDPTIRIVTGGAFSSHLSFNVPSAYFASRTYVDDTFAPLADPALTGNPTAPTAALDDSDTSIATTAFVQGFVPTVTTTWTAHSADTNFVVNLAVPYLQVSASTNFNLIHTTNGTANFTANRVYSTEIMLLNDTANNSTNSFPATWKALGSETVNNWVLDAGKYAIISIQFAGPSTSQTNNWISVVLQQGEE